MRDRFRTDEIWRRMAGTNDLQLRRYWNRWSGSDRRCYGFDGQSVRSHQHRRVHQHAVWRLDWERVRTQCGRRQLEHHPAFLFSRLRSDLTGNLYGATNIGGFTNMQCGGSIGNVFELSAGGGSWNITQLSYFLGCDFGSGPLNLIRDSIGNLYGVAEGGVPGCAFDLGCGVVFKLSQTGQEWDMTEVDDFSGGAGGDTPWAVTLVGGKLYGVTTQGGASGSGTVFEITP